MLNRNQATEQLLNAPGLRLATLQARGSGADAQLTLSSLSGLDPQGTKGTNRLVQTKNRSIPGAAQ